VRAVVELAGITDIYTKSYGSRTKANTAKATLKALAKLRTIEEIAALRDISVNQILK
ncbi:MAG: 30S ribosomal protein S5, partial [Mycoplasmataceae bacterium]|nr:30S ribosomal protein S5 [Mycoplasmataceae bacterium]